MRPMMQSQNKLPQPSSKPLQIRTKSKTTASPIILAACTDQQHNPRLHQARLSNPSNNLQSPSNSTDRSMRAIEMQAVQPRSTSKQDKQTCEHEYFSRFRDQSRNLMQLHPCSTAVQSSKLISKPASNNATPQLGIAALSL